ncbi:MAG: hypothetical protein V1859_07765 [archaeon]
MDEIIKKFKVEANVKQGHESELMKSKESSENPFTKFDVQQTIDSYSKVTKKKMEDTMNFLRY